MFQQFKKKGLQVNNIADGEDSSGTGNPDLTYWLHFTTSERCSTSCKA